MNCLDQEIRLANSLLKALYIQSTSKMLQMTGLWAQLRPHILEAFKFPIEIIDPSDLLLRIPRHGSEDA